MKNLRFIKAEPSVNTSLVPGTGSAVQREDAFGNMRQTGQIIGGKYERTADKREWSKLQFLAKDQLFVVNALSWHCIDPDCYFSILNPKTVGNDILEAELKGRFSPRPKLEDVCEMVESYKLLANHFLKYMDIYDSKHDHKWIIPSLDYLINKRTSLPGWVAKTIELRNQGGTNEQNYT